MLKLASPRTLTLAAIVLALAARAGLAQQAQKLDTVKVASEGTRRLITGRDAFALRRARGFGRFFDANELGDRGALTVGDLLRGEQGISIVRAPTCTAPTGPSNPNALHNNCVTNSATHVAVTRRLCAVKLLLDGVSLAAGGEIDTRDQGFDPSHNWLTAFDLTTLDIARIEKVEVYRRAEDIPAEFKSSDIECGLVVLWTRE